MISNAAQAQCNADSNPPPASPQHWNLANQSFGATPPLTLCDIKSRGVVGCNGTDGGRGDSGGDGSPGQAGGQIDSTNKALTIIGGSPPDPGFNSFGAPIFSGGGPGGNGGQAGVTNSSVQGGAGSIGGAGGRVTVSFDGAFVPGPNAELATHGLEVTSTGNSGGNGGDPNHYGIAAKQAGPGGPGGSVAMVASGSVRVSAFGVVARSIAGPGGNGGNATSFDKLDTTTGGDGGNGGTGGAVSAQWLGGAIVSSWTGLQATSDGGFGGRGGISAFALGTGGGNGGKGGDSGPATALFTSGGITVNLISGLPTPGSGIFVATYGGLGGHGGAAGFGLSAVGGSGGNGGDAGAASATVLSTVTVNGSAGLGQIGQQVISQGVLVQANGGPGGAGADARALTGQSGGGGFAGAGGAVTLTFGNATSPGAIRTSGNFTHGALVQSIGGGGGNGGQANFNTVGGGGAAGGDAGAVVVDAPNGSVIATGNNSSALLAQSIGGGGGLVRSMTTDQTFDPSKIAINPQGRVADIQGFSLTLGGQKGATGNGGAVLVTTGGLVMTSGLDAHAILAQSIGGDGGMAAGGQMDRPTTAATAAAEARPSRSGCNPEPGSSRAATAHLASWRKVSAAAVGRPAISRNSMPF